MELNLELGWIFAVAINMKIIFLFCIAFYAQVCFAGQFNSRTSSMSYLFHFNENSGTAPRNARNQNNGTFTGTPVWVSGLYRSALSFTGTDNYVSLTNADMPQGNNARTYLFLVLYAAAPTAGNYLMAVPNGGGSNLTIGALGGPPFYLDVNLNGAWQAYGGPITAKRWMGAAFRYEAPIGTFFVVSGTTTFISSKDLTSLTTASQGSFVIGNNGDGGATASCGCTMDEVMIVNRAMSDAEIISHLRNALYPTASIFNP